MKIAVFHHLPSGGALKAMNEMLYQFKKEGHSLKLYSFSTAEHTLVEYPKLDEKTILTFQLKGMARFKNYEKISQEIAQKINDSDCDWVMVHKCRFVGSPSVLKYLTKPTVFYTQEPLRFKEYESLAPQENQAYSSSFKLASQSSLWQSIKKIGKIYSHFKIKKTDRENIESAQKILTNSQFTQKWLKRVYDVDAEVRSLGVNTDFFSPAAENRKKRVLSVGRLSAIKGYDFLAHVLAEIPKDDRPGWDIVCDEVDPGFQKAFEGFAQKQGLDYQIHCRISEEDLRTFYRTSAFVLCASSNEPFGLVPLEAMACETPVLAVTEGGFLETVLGSGGGEVLERDLSKWSTKIKTLLLKSDERVEMGKRGRDYVVDHWNWSSFNQGLSPLSESQSSYSVCT